MSNTRRAAHSPHSTGIGWVGSANVPVNTERNSTLKNVYFYHCFYCCSFFSPPPFLLLLQRSNRMFSQRIIYYSWHLKVFTCSSSLKQVTHKSAGPSTVSLLIKCVHLYFYFYLTLTHKTISSFVKTSSSWGVMKICEYNHISQIAEAQRGFFTLWTFLSFMTSSEASRLFVSRHKHAQASAVTARTLEWFGIRAPKTCSSIDNRGSFITLLVFYFVCVFICVLFEILLNLIESSASSNCDRRCGRTGTFLIHAFVCVRSFCDEVQVTIETPLFIHNN